MTRRIRTTRHAVLARRAARERRRKAYQDRADFLMMKIGNPAKYPMGARTLALTARQIEYFLQAAEYQDDMMKREYAERNPVPLLQKISF